MDREKPTVFKPLHDSITVYCNAQPEHPRVTTVHHSHCAVQFGEKTHGHIIYPSLDPKC